MRLSTGMPAVRSAIASCTSTAHRTASMTLWNSARSPSPIVLTMRPRCSAIFGSEKFAANTAQCSKRALLIGTHQTRIADDIDLRSPPAVARRALRSSVGRPQKYGSRDSRAKLAMARVASRQRGLKSVGPNATLVEDDIEAVIRGLKAQLIGEIQVGGPDLARSLTDLGLIDEYRLYFHPVVLGRGKPFFAGPRPPLRLAASDRIGEDVIRLTYVPA